MSLINSQTDSNLFFIEFIFRCLMKMFFCFFIFMFCRFLKVSALESFLLMRCWESDFSNLFLQKFVLLIGALCQLSNLLKANKMFSTSLFVSFQFKWRPLLLQSYFGLIFQFLIKQIFLLGHSLLRCLFTSIAFALILSLRGNIPETNTLLLSDLHNKATSIMSLLISLALFSFFRLFVLQWRTMFFGLPDLP